MCIPEQRFTLEVTGGAPLTKIVCICEYHLHLLWILNELIYDWETPLRNQESLTNNTQIAPYCWHSLHANAWCFFCPSRKTTWHIRPSWEVVFLKRFTVDIYTLLQWSWRGVYWFHLVCPSVHLSICGLNHVHSVFTLILAGSISHLHILSTNYMYCVSCWISAQYFYLRICTSCSGFLWTLYMTLLTFDPTHDIGSVFEKWMGPNLFQTFQRWLRKWI